MKLRFPLILIALWAASLVIICRVLAVVTPTAANVVSLALAAGPNGSITFPAGLYDFTGIKLPACHYIGLPGATIVSGKGSVNGKQVDCVLLGGEFEGFAYNAGQFVLMGGCDVHGNIVGGSANVYINGGAANGSFLHNTFNGSANFPLTGYPGNVWDIEYNLFDIRAVNGGSGPQSGQEAMHLIGAADSITVSNNVCVGTTLRWGFELQLGMTHLKIENNYIHAVSGNAISCATGGSPTAPFGGQGEHIHIAGNTLVDDNGALSPCCAIEIMGDLDVVIENNYCSGYGTGILNGTGGQANQGLITRNNTFITIGGPYADGDNTPWKVPPRQSTGDRVFKVGSPGIPAAPAQPTQVGAKFDPALPGNQPPIVIPPTPEKPVIPAPTNFKAVPQVDGIHLSWDAVPGATGYTLIWRTPAGDTKSQTVTGTSLVDVTVPNQWVVNYALTATTGSGLTATATAQAQALPNQVFTPPPVVTPPAGPVKVHQFDTYSDGSVKQVM